MQFAVHQRSHSISLWLNKVYNLRDLTSANGGPTSGPTMAPAGRYWKNTGSRWSIVLLSSRGGLQETRRGDTERKTRDNDARPFAWITFKANLLWRTDCSGRLAEDNAPMREDNAFRGISKRDKKRKALFSLTLPHRLRLETPSFLLLIQRVKVLGWTKKVRSIIAR